jgi:hypothetical protein
MARESSRPAPGKKAAGTKPTEIETRTGRAKTVKKKEGMPPVSESGA